MRRIATNRRVIVFMHGVLGDGRSTWTNTATGAYWPDLLAHDNSFDGYDIFVFAYPSPYLGKSYSIDELADNLRLYLDSKEFLKKYDEIIFLSHSMGGLVTRAFLLKYRNYAAKVKFLYFFSTPTTGSAVANVAKLASKNPQFGKMVPMTDEAYLADLQRQWLAAQFPIASYCAYEKLNIFGMRVVEEQSATNLCNRRLDPINDNHTGVVKPTDQGDLRYLAFLTAFKETRAIDAPNIRDQPVASEQPRKVIPFHVESMRSDFAITAIVDGHLEFMQNAITVKVDWALLRRWPTKYEGRWEIASIKAAISEPSAVGGFQFVSESRPLLVGKELTLNTQQRLEGLTLQIPLEQKASLSAKWLTFQFESIALDMPDPQRRIGFAYAHSDSDLLQQ